MEQRTMGLLFFGAFFLLIFYSVSVRILLGMVVLSEVIGFMLLASLGDTFSWSFSGYCVLTVGFFVVCQISGWSRNVRILSKA